MKNRKLLSVAVLLFASLALIGCTKKDTLDVLPDESTDIDVVVDDIDTEDEEIVEEQEITTDEEDINDTVLEGFSSTKQTAGVDSDAEYTLKPIDLDALTDYYRVTLLFETVTEDYTASKLPYITAEYSSSKNAVVLRIDGLDKDESGIATMKSIDINKQGLTKIYHAVSGTAGIAVYEIGSSSKPEFKLSVDSVNAAKVYLDVKYPTLTEEVVNPTGRNEDFTLTKQIIVGGKSANGSGITRLSWLSSGGILNIVFEVKGDEAQPVPDCYAEYVDGKLNLVFTDLKYSTSKTTQTYTLPTVGSVRLVPMENGEYRYVFDSVTDKMFRLNKNLSPNQIQFEIKLR
jgi:hypothetical protein